MRRELGRVGSVGESRLLVKRRRFRGWEDGPLGSVSAAPVIVNITAVQAGSLLRQRDGEKEEPD